MELKDIKLVKGMTRDEVNKLTKDYILLEDEVYLGNASKHNWICLCGNLIEGRQWSNIKYDKRIKCKLCKYNEIELRYKTEVEKDGDYEYIRSYRMGDILPNGKTVGRKTYIQVKHKYCGNIYEIQTGNFINEGSRCGKCCHKYENSFAYHIEVELGEPLEKYWDFEKNTVNPYHISKNRNGKNKSTGKNTKVWIKCQEKDYHGSYEISCYNFVSKVRCGYCNTYGIKVHYKDSFGYKHPDKAKCWHEDNDKSPYEVSYNSGKKFKFRCDECGYIWEARISGMVNMDSWCQNCASSKGEKRISEWLILNNINHEKEKIFKGLISDLGNPLRFDFYLPNYNLLIEYDGLQHFKPIKHFGGLEKFTETKIRDTIKNKYCENNDIELIRIPYWEFDNIEYILEKELITYSKIS